MHSATNGNLFAPVIDSAFEAFSQGRTTVSLQLLETVISRDPVNFDALNGAGIVSYHLQDAPRAITYLERAHQLRPGELGCSRNLAGLLLQTNQLDRAAACLNRALREHGTDTHLLELHRTVAERRKLSRIPLTVCSRIDLCRTSPEVRQRDGDYWFSRHLKQALIRRGATIDSSHPAALLLLHGAMPAYIPPEWYSMLWIHSHPYELTPEKLNLFDAVFSLSPFFTAKLKTLGYPAETLIGGTACRPPDPPPGIQHGIVFVGNARRLSGTPQMRPILTHLLALGGEWVNRLEVWGCGWENLLPAACIRGTCCDNHRLNELYASSMVILNDHHEDMRAEGFLNPRILDVMASGGLVLSDPLHNHPQLFGDALLVCDSPESLCTTLEHIYTDPAFRSSMIEKGRRAVRDYSFDRAADRLVKHLLTVDIDAARTARRQRIRPTEGNEAWIEYRKDRVIKRYKPASFAFDRQYARRGEAYYLAHYPSPFFIHACSITEEQIELENGGRPIGRFDPSAPGRRVLEPDGLNLVSLVAWLKALKKELRRLGLKHRDINPTNILYNDKSDRFVLIDFGWMIQNDDPDGPETRPETLNPYAGSDDEAIDRLIREAVQAQIARINRSRHYDGSSTRAGWVYHPIAFDDFKAPVHKTAALEELQEVIQYGGIHETTPLSILEIGSSIGYFAFNLARRHCRVTAYEADSDACAAAEAMRLAKEVEGVRFINKSFGEDDLPAECPPYDLTLMLNVHMWIHKALGPDQTTALMRRLAGKTRRMLFQTAHAESGGMYRVDELKTVNDVAAYLRDCGFRRVQHIRNTGAHHGLRALFLCEGVLS